MTESLIAAAATGHGAIRDYRRGCRCDECRKANTDYARLTRHRRWERIGYVPRQKSLAERGLERCGSCKQILPKSREHLCPNEVPRNCRECSRPLRATGQEAKMRICTTCYYPTNQQRKVETWAALKASFGGCCNRCGYAKCTRALCFHHLDASEKGIWRKDRRTSVREIRGHPERFELLCANCHAEEHAGQEPA